jgi:hypothetical protein
MIIATRELTAICKSGEKKPVVLRLEAPVQEDGFWRCWYEIDWPEDEGPARTRRFYAGGEDAMQALQLGLMALGIELHTNDYHDEHRLFWDEPEAGYGLIVPRNLRDKLRGDDITFYGD